MNIIIKVIYEQNMASFTRKQQDIEQTPCK